MFQSSTSYPISTPTHTLEIHFPKHKLLWASLTPVQSQWCQASQSIQQGKERFLEIIPSVPTSKRDNMSYCLIYFSDLPCQVVVPLYFSLLCLLDILTSIYHKTYQDPFIIIIIIIITAKAAAAWNTKKSSLNLIKINGINMNFRKKEPLYLFTWNPTPFTLQIIHLISISFNSLNILYQVTFGVISILSKLYFLLILCYIFVLYLGIRHNNDNKLNISLLTDCQVLLHYVFMQQYLNVNSNEDISKKL